MYQTDCNQLLSRFEEGVVTISFNRPQEENLINYAMLMAMRELFNQAARDDKVRAVVLKGEGSCFCGGDDWQNMGEWPGEFAHRKPGGSHGAAPIPEQETIKALRSIMKPTIALLHGSVLGLGLDLAAVCDLRVASTDASIGDPRIQPGESICNRHYIPVAKADWPLAGQSDFTDGRGSDGRGSHTDSACTSVD